MAATTQETSTDALLIRVAQLEAALSTERAARATSEALAAKLEKDVAVLRASYERLRQELELLRHRIFVAKAERIDSKQLELEFAAKLAALDELARQIPTPSSGVEPASVAPPPASSGGSATKPGGRRNLRALKIPEVRIEITDPVYERLVEEGKAARMPFEESCKLAWQRGGQRKLIIARAQYKTLRVVGATWTSRPWSVTSNAVTRVCFNASRVRSKVMARMRAASLLSLKNPEGNRSLHAHLFAPSGAPRPRAATVEKSGPRPVLTHPLKRQGSHIS